MDSRVLVDVDLREDDLLLDTESVVTLSVHGLCHTVEVTDTWEDDADKLLEELVHLGVTECNLCADGLALTKLEVGDILLGNGNQSLLSADERKLLCSLLHEFAVLSSFAKTLVDGNLEKLRALHYCSVVELLHQRVHNLLPVGFLEGRNISCRQSLNLNCFCCLCHNYLISSPDFLA